MPNRSEVRSSAVDDYVENRRLYAAFMSLPEEQRAPLVLSYFVGKTHVEIARELGLSLGTTKSRISLGLRRLGKALKSKGAVVKRHIDELAELYALGSLEADERARGGTARQGLHACADRIRAAEETVAFISDLEAHHEPPQAIAENFASRLAISRHAQKQLSLKVITTAFVGGLIVLGFVR